MTNDTGLSGGELDESVTQKAVFEKRTEEEQQEIEQNLEAFKATNVEAERELEKWDDSQVRLWFITLLSTIVPKNDMIALARKMTQIMHQMTEYTRGEGQLKTNKGKISYFDLKTNLKNRRNPCRR